MIWLYWSSYHRLLGHTHTCVSLSSLDLQRWWHPAKCFWHSFKCSAADVVRLKYSLFGSDWHSVTLLHIDWSSWAIFCSNLTTCLDRLPVKCQYRWWFQNATVEKEIIESSTNSLIVDEMFKASHWCTTRTAGAQGLLLGAHHSLHFWLPMIALHQEPLSVCVRWLSNTLPIV